MSHRSSSFVCQEPSGPSLHRLRELTASNSSGPAESQADATDSSFQEDQPSNLFDGPEPDFVSNLEASVAASLLHGCETDGYQDPECDPEEPQGVE